MFTISCTRMSAPFASLIKFSLREVSPEKTIERCTREDGEIETETGRDFLVLTRSLLRLGIAWGSHLDSAQAATLDSPLDQPRGLGLFDEVADVGDTSGVTLRDNHCHEDDPEAVLQHTKAGEP